MTEETQGTEDKAPLVNIKRENYQTSHTATGGKSLNNGDFVANLIEGMTNDELYTIADKFLTFPVKAKGEKIEDVDGLQAVYADLNTGMQRMNLGNRFRKQVRAIDIANEKAADKAVADGKQPKATKSGEEKLTAVASPVVKVRDKRLKDEAVAKAKAAKEAAAKAKKEEAA